MSRTHGTPSTYLWGCRCFACRAANSADVTARLAARAARLAADPSIVPHGKRSTYSNWGCRCQLCIAANTVYCNAYNRRRRARKVTR